MKFKILPLIIILMVITMSSYAQIIRPFAIRYSNPSEKGNIVFVANSIMSTQGVGTGNPGTGEPPPAGTSRNNTGAGIYIDADGPVPPAPVTIFNYGSGWRYHDQFAAAPPNDGGGNNWKTLAYTEPVTWLGPGAGGPYGYNDAQVVTAVNFNVNTNRTPTIYFRKIINIPTPSTYSYITFNVRRDDGCAVYLNGTLVSPTAPADVMNFPATWTHTTLAITDGVEGTDEYISFNVPATSFNAGNNIIAVEVKNGFTGNNPANKSDLLFDMQLIGVLPTPSNVTFNSSTADLSVASCSNVLFAGLYWGAGQGTSGTNTAWITGETTCKLKLPGAASYINITSTQTDYHNSTLSVGLPHTGYKCFADITSLLNTSSPNGTYAVANVVGPVGIANSYAGWTIVIVYKNPSLPPRNLTVYDGNVIINGGDPPVDVIISGFLTPPSGTVSCELGAVVFDGDRGSLDAYAFEQAGGASFYDLATTTVPLNGTSDAWNSKISYKGTVVTTRNPAYQNTVGYDAAIIDLPNAGNAQLGNSKTGATVRFSSPGENYFVQVVTTSISQFDPSFALEKGSTDVNGGTLVGGDIIRYRINYSNVGNDASINTIITDNIPAATSFVPGSININGVVKTDAAGDDQAEYDYVNRRVVLRIGTGANAANGGSVASLAPVGYIEFDVYAASSCTVLSCGTPTNNIARIDYNGQTSGIPLYDSSGYNLAGCLTQGPISNVITGSCFNPGDTTLINVCPSTTIMLPIAKYAGYTFYSAMPFIPSNVYNATTPITSSGIYYAYFNSGPGCTDTIRINVFRQNCPDIDEDDDGLPDYLELNNPVALQDLDLDGIPNWNDNTYPGWIDNNTDGLNDNFDPGADSDNDGLANFMETGWPGYTDTDGDGINDMMDHDLDGIPDFLDRDSDNDGIPDVVESNGVDANGDGRIDNFTDADSDGLSQNVDGSTGVAGSGNGLGAVDTDVDGIPNYMDTDSDNDGIPDVIEVYGTDANNDGKLDGTTDNDLDGYTDSVDGDVGNDGIAENSAAALLKTGTDGNNDGRADSYSDKNMDGDSKANPYDLDSDGDGIVDVIEAGFPDTNYNGRIDGGFNSNGWSTLVAGYISLSLPNTEGSGRVNIYDIDSDDDGIPDNVEGLPTVAYLLPSGLDSDGDGINNSYDNYVGFGGNGIPPVDTDGDTQPDYLDTDADSDGVIDLYEGSDLNFNNLIDDGVALSGLDTDGDGLDNFFDANNSSAEGTSQFMGNGGSVSGDPSPGTIATVQHTAIANAGGCVTERDWRCIPYALSCHMINFNGLLQDQLVRLNWTVLCRQDVDHFIIERSIDKVAFGGVVTIPGRPTINESESYHATDDISTVTSDIIYYRLKTILRNGRTSIGNVVVVRRNNQKAIDVQVAPNPVRDVLQVFVNTTLSSETQIYIMDRNGKAIQKYTERLLSGSNIFKYNQVNNLPNGIYYLRLNIGDQFITKKFSILK